MTIMTKRIYTCRNSSAREIRKPSVWDGGCRLYCSSYPFISTGKEPTLLLHFGGSSAGSWITLANLGSCWRELQNGLKGRAVVPPKRLVLLLIAAFCRLAKFLSLLSAHRSLLRAVGWRHPRPKDSGCHSCRLEFTHEPDHRAYLPP